jgi:hypothetical protein
MVTVCPPTLTVAVRVGPAFCWTEKLRAPLPKPDVGTPSEIHGALLCADHVQSAVVVIEIVPLPPSAPKLEVVAAAV